MRRLCLILVWTVAHALATTRAHAQCTRCANASFGPVIRVLGPDLVYSNSAVIADFDGDGIPDIAVRQLESIAVFLGPGAANFTPAILTPVPDIDLNVKIVTGDFNEDGKPDLAVGIFGQGAALLLGGGNGRFLVGPVPPGGTPPLAIGAGDVDGDGHLDMVGFSADGNVTLSRGDGKGSLTVAGVFPTGSSSTYAGSIAVNDVNGDSHADIAVTLGYPGLVVLMGSAAGFSPPITLDYQSHTGVVIADATGDGKLDVIASGTFPGNTAVYPGDGAGAFGAPISVDMGSGPSALAVADLNRDGKPDLAAISYQYEELVTRLGDGAGGFGPVQRVYIGYGPGSLAVADLDGDGSLDYVTGNNYDVSIAMGDGTGGFAVKPFPSGPGPNSVAVADFDGDGKADVVIANYGGAPPFLTLFRGLGSGSFGPAQVLAGLSPSPASAVAADFNADGRPDLFVTDSFPSSIGVHLNDGSGHFTAAPRLAPPCSSGGIPPVITDLNGDGFADLAFPCDDSVRVLLGDGTGRFAAATSIVVQARWLAVGDVDGDGHPDLVSSGPFSQQIFVCLGDGHGNFSAPIGTYPPHFQVNGFVLADFDGDGHIDVATAAFANAQFLDVAFGDGTGTFGRPRSFPAGELRSVTFGKDLDGDGRPDIGSVQSPGFGVLMNDGAGNFLEPRSFVSALVLESGDVDGDGLFDLVWTDPNRDVFGVFLNTNCKARHLSFLPATNLCSPSGAPVTPSPTVKVLDDGGNLVTCATGTVTASLASGTPGAVLTGTTTEPVAVGLAAFPDLSIDLPGTYRLGFAHSGAARPTAGGIRIGSGISVSVSGPPLVCGKGVALYDAGAGYDRYVWTLDGSPVGFDRTFTAPFLGAGSHILAALAGLGPCEGTASVAISNAPPTLTAVAPSKGSRGGGTVVQASGGCIAGAATLDFGGRRARDVEVLTSSTMLATTRSHLPGTVDVVLTNPDGQSSTLASAFTFPEGTNTYTLAPCRVLDTRLPTGPLGGPVIGAGRWRYAKLTGVCGIPEEAVALVVNVTVTGPTAAGGVRVLSISSADPGIDFVSFAAGQTRANNGLLVLPDLGTGYVAIGNASTGTVHVIIDVTGYFY